MMTLTFGALAALTAACGGEDDATIDTGTGSTGPTGSADSLEVSFSPMYSGFDGVHKYRLPVFVEGETGVKFTASDPSFVDIEETSEGAMLTTKKAGKVTIIAEKDGKRSSAKLMISEYTPEQWALGENRYNNGNAAWESPMVMLADTGLGVEDSSTCTACHSESGAIAIVHTPWQTGGYSDAELANIFVLGQLPEGVRLQISSDTISPKEWSAVHQWKMKKEDHQGIVAYLRAMAPVGTGIIREPPHLVDLPEDLADPTPCPTDGAYPCGMPPGSAIPVCVDPATMAPPECTEDGDCEALGLTGDCINVFEDLSYCVQPCTGDADVDGGKTVAEADAGPGV